MDIKGLMKEWRMLVLLFTLIASAAAMQPTWQQDNQGNYDIVFTGLQDNLGTEFTGGTRLLLSLQTNETDEDLKNLATDVSSTLRLRANQLDVVKDPQVNVVNVDGWKVRVVAQVDENQTNSTLEEIIAEQGSFEARITLPVEDQKTISLANSDYRIEDQEPEVTLTRLNGSQQQIGTLQQGESTVIEDYQLYYVNRTGSTAELEMLVYTGDGLANVEAVMNGADSPGGGYSRYDWLVPITLKTESARTYQTFMENFGTDVSNTRYIHDDGSNVQLKYYLDNKLRTNLSIQPMGQSLETDRVIQIPASAATQQANQEARQEAERIRTILESGSLAVPIQVESRTELGSTLGAEFMTVSIVSIALSLVAVALLVFMRYRRPKIAIPLFLTGSSEVFILLGLWFSTLGELTLAAVAGIIAAVGTGVDDQIIITDESTRDEVRSWKKRMKTAFFVIFTSAASTIGAMTPIVSPALANLGVGLAGVGLIGYYYYSNNQSPHYLAIGILGLLVAAVSYPLAGSGDALISIRGFATTTIFGIMVGIAITRPAYSKTLEYLDE